MAQSLPLASKTKSCAPNSVKFSPNNLYYNYSCAGFHELNMRCVWEWDAIEVNDKRQPVIEVVATWAYWTNPWLGHVTGCSPMAPVLFTTKPGQLGKLISHLSCIWYLSWIATSTLNCEQSITQPASEPTSAGVFQIGPLPAPAPETH